MLLWEAQPQDQPYPATHLTYEVTVTNTDTTPARNVHAYLGSDLFGWQEMAFDDDQAGGGCPELAAGKSNAWGWGYNWNTHADPAWRPSMEQTAQLRFVWAPIPPSRIFTRITPELIENP